MMTTLLVSLIAISWIAIALAGLQASVFNEQATDFEAIAVPVKDPSAFYVGRSSAYGRH